jgi:NAD+ synthase (glutamine-hydrolysing)
MKVAIAQFNATVGDLIGNADKITSLTKQAKSNGASLVITPELGLCGYPPEDLLFRQDFIIANQKILNRIAASVTDIALLIGHPHYENGNLYNAASLIQQGKITATYHKQI